jgi:hypothetical protein
MTETFHEPVALKELQYSIHYSHISTTKVIHLKTAIKCPKSWPVIQRRRMFWDFVAVSINIIQIHSSVPKSFKQATANLRYENEIE